MPKGAWEDRKVKRRIERDGNIVLFYHGEHMSSFDDNGPDHPCSRKFRINYLTGGSVPEEHLTYTPVNPYDYYYQKHLHELRYGGSTIFWNDNIPGMD